MSQLITYEKFFNSDQAQPVLAVLKEHTIPHEFAAIKQVVDQVIAGGGPGYQFEVRIPAGQFVKANRLLRESIQVNLGEVDPDYYLFSFEDFELIEILRMPDEWGRLDFAIARKILESRGIVYTNDELDALWKNRIEVLARPEHEGAGWVFAGRFFAIMGGFFGVLIGLVLLQSTKTLPDGRKVYTYDEQTRKKGKTILIVSLIVFAVCLFFGLSSGYVFVTDLTQLPQPQCEPGCFGC
ncbi:hypothetical protein [Niastella populi]|uniref:Uncharacterized protein n=1 Tax=Niastella populi TaxID=550983 RepID=A0A1V9G1U0_9BACT|nr:hypothetical protein [Niastella populi]OQP64542.1 hypothetical protein A4R26_15950 [Niastella populi]